MLISSGKFWGEDNLFDMSLIRQYIAGIKRSFFDQKNPYTHFIKIFKGLNGIEIGGPTELFAMEFPVYPGVAHLDCANFSSSTVWEGSIKEGLHFNYYKDKKGFQYIHEASDLSDIESEKYDFLLASHCLEHCANTIKTMKEWLRVLKQDGYILLVLPDKRFTFDHKRNITPFNHLLEDYQKNVDERDMTHLEEILSLHDLTLDPPAGDIEAFRQRSLKNFENRCLHHHVFDFPLLTQLFSYLNIEVSEQLFVKPYHQIIIGKKK